MGNETIYPELASVLSLACSTVSDSFSLGEANDLVDALERLGTEAVVEEYVPLKGLVTCMSDPTAGTDRASLLLENTRAFADRVAAIAATLFRRSNEFASWFEGVPPTATAQAAANLLSEVAARSFTHAQTARTLIEGSASPRSDPGGDTPGDVAQRLALAISYDMAVEIMTLAAHRATYYREHDA